LVVATLQVPASVAPVSAAAAAKPEKVSDRPDRTSAMIAAISQDSRVEDVSARTPSSSMFANPDGTWTVESFSGVVRSETEPGEWVEVDPTLERADGGSGSVDGVVPVAVPFSVKYGDGGSKRLASVAAPGGGDLSVQWPAKLPQATVDADKVTFADPGAGTNADRVEVTSYPEGFNFSVILDEAPEADARPEYRFPLNLNGVKGGRFVERKDGTIDVLVKNQDDRGPPQTVATITAPVMWDSADEPTQVPVEATLEGDGDNRTLVLRPDPAYLANADRIYPVTVDPTVVLTTSGDTWVQNLTPTTSQHTSPELRVGTSSLGVNQSRSYLSFDTSSLGTITAASVANAKVTVSNFEAGSCSGQAIRLSQITSTWTLTGLTWANQPTNTTTGSSTNSTGYGATGCTSEGTVDFDATAIVKSWAGGATNYGVQLRADNAGVNASWRKYRSMENGDAAKSPKLTVTINQLPDTPTGLMVDPGGYGNFVRSKTPALSAVVTDPDGGQVKGYFEVKQGATLVWSGTSTATSSGGRVSIDVPTGKLTEGSIYTVNAYGEDDLASRSATAALRTVVVDSIAPTVTVSSAQFTNGSWKATTPGSDTITYTGTSDTGGFWVDYDGVRVAAGANASGNATVTYTPKPGWHVIAVTPVDKAGNHGTPVTFSYGSGAPALTTPAQWTPSTASFPVEMSGPTTSTSAYLQWRVFTETTWRTAAKVKKTDGTAWTGAVTNSGRATPGPLVWNATEETYGTGTLTAPKLLEIRGCFKYTGSADSCTSAVYVSLFKSGFGDRSPSADLGPAQVALTNGELLLTDADAADSTAGVGRTFMSLSESTLGNGLFGPAWSQPILLTPSEDSSLELIDNRSTDGSMIVVDGDGGSQVFVPAGSSTAFKPLQPTGDSTSLTFTPGTPDVFELSRPLANSSVKTKWEWKASDTGGQPAWVFRALDSPGTSGDLVVTATAQRPIFVAESDPGVAATCTATTQTVGCRALRVSYVGTGSATRVAKIERVIGAATPSAVDVKTLADYTYSSGRLSKVCGPVPVAGGSSLCTEYTYTTVAGRTLVATMKPAGQTEWRFAYDTLGRVLNVKRARPSASGGGDATWAVDYGLSTGSAGLPNLSASAVAEWGQTVVPSKVYAVYAPSVGAADVSEASLIYTDASGQTTNTATHGPTGWLVDTVWYDPMGNAVQHLDSMGWSRVQAAPPTDRRRVAVDASAFTVYNSWGSADVVGSRLTDEYGPAHRSTLEDGTIGQFRTHTSYTYDDDPAVDPALIAGRPTTAGLGLVVKRTTSSATADRSADFDPKVVKFGYSPVVAGDGSGWDLGQATTASVKVDASTWSTETTRFDEDGNVIESRAPGGGSDSAGAGNDARSTVTTYYRATGTGDCGGKPAWAGQVCKVGPAAQPAGQTIPGSHFASYDSELRPTSVLETSGSSLRTTTTTYDGIGRKSSTVASTSGPGVRADTITTAYGYDASNGQLATVSASGASISITRDAWGRQVGYSDATGNTGSSTYDGAGRIIANESGGVAVTYSYGAHGILSGAEFDGGVGNFAYAYNSNGTLKSIDYPNGISLKYSLNEVGTPEGVDYVASGAPLLSFTSTNAADGHSLRQTSPASSQNLAYDGSGRLTRVQDTRSGTCKTRAYGYSASSDRTSTETFDPNSVGTCQTSVPGSSRAHSFDSASRVTNPGYTYDALGRMLSIPVGDLQVGTGALSLSYRANDMVSSTSQSYSTGSGSETRASEYALDPTGRVDGITTKVDGVETQRLNYRYGSETDSPSSVRRSSDGGASWSVTNYASAPELGLVAEIEGGAVTFHLSNMNGSTVARATPAGGIASYSETDEFGNGGEGPTPSRYGWLGGYQRSRDALGGLMLMGARLYNPRTALFTSIDSVPGGTPTPYAYPHDPINNFDTSGRASASKVYTYWWGGYRFYEGFWDRATRIWWNQRMVRKINSVGKWWTDYGPWITSAGTMCPDVKVCKIMAGVAFALSVLGAVWKWRTDQMIRDMEGFGFEYKIWNGTGIPKSWKLYRSEYAWGLGITKKRPSSDW